VNRLSGKPKYDWEDLRNTYVSGGDEITLEALTADGGPHIVTLKKRASAEDWTGQRRAFRYQTTTKTLEHASTTEAEVAARHAKAARALMAAGLRALQALDPTKLRPGELREFIATAADMERKALGLEVSRVDVTHHNERPAEPPREALEEAARELAALLN
jgi:hypothetical protein